MDSRPETSVKGPDHPVEEILDVLPAEVTDGSPEILTVEPVQESPRRSDLRPAFESRAHRGGLHCPNCSGSIRLTDQECPRCRRTLETSALMEEEKQLTKQLAQLRRLVWVFGLPGIVCLFTSSILFAGWKAGGVQELTWPILAGVAALVLIITGSCFEAATRRLTATKRFLFYGALGLAIQKVFTADKLDRLARIRVLLDCRKEARDGSRRV